MQPEQLIERSPMRAVAASIRGGLAPGQVGVVLAPAGVGKSAFMVQVALHSLLKGSPVLHISLRDNQARVRSFYDEILAEIAQAARPGVVSQAQVSVERSRVIHSCLGRSFDADDLRALMATLSEVMDFCPTLVMVDGLDAKDMDTDSLAAVASESNIRLWISVRTHRSSGPSAEKIAESFDTAVTLSPSGSGVDLHILRSGGMPSTESESLSLDPVTMMVRPEDVRDPATAPPSPHPSVCTLYSGGATGAEVAFGEAAEKWNISEVNFTFEGHKQSRSQGTRLLSERELSAGDVSLVYVAHRLHRHWDRTTILRKVLQTQWHVVSHAAQVFVVGVIQPDGTVHGGTGWSVELARRWNKRVWVFDQNHEAWYTWTGSEWSKGEPVIETPTFAGTGTRFLNDAGRLAVRELFERSFGLQG